MPLPDDLNKTALADEVAAALTSAWEADPAAMHCLIVNRVPCNAALADHPYVGVDSSPVVTGRQGEAEPNFVGALGVINGVLRCLGLPPVGVKFDGVPDMENRQRIVGFGVAHFTCELTRVQLIERLKQWVLRHEMQEPNLIRIPEAYLTWMRSHPDEFTFLDAEPWPPTKLLGCDVQVVAGDQPLEFARK